MAPFFFHVRFPGFHQFQKHHFRLFLLRQQPGQLLIVRSGGLDLLIQLCNELFLLFNFPFQLADALLLLLGAG